MSGASRGVGALGWQGVSGCGRGLRGIMGGRFQGPALGWQWCRWCQVTSSGCRVLGLAGGVGVSEGW